VTKAPLERRLRASRLRRRWRAALPWLTWTAALAAAVILYRQRTLVSPLTGYARSTTVALAHDEPGVVRQVAVQLYDEVAAGQVLVSLDDQAERLELAVLEQDIQRLRAAVDAEEERLKQATAQQHQDALDLARQLAVDRETAHLDLLGHQLAIAQDQAELAGQRFEYEILRRLTEDGNASGRELNEIRTTVQRLEAGVQQRKTLIVEAQTVFDSRDRLWHDNLARPGQDVAVQVVLAPLRLEIEVRSRELADVVRRLEGHVLRAPCDGQVALLNVSAGDYVAPSTTVVALAPSTTDQVVAYLPESMTHTVHPGDEALLSCPATASGAVRHLVGRVTRVAPAVTEVPLRYRTLPSYPQWGRGVVIQLSAGRQLIPGEAVRIRFRPAPAEEPSGPANGVGAMRNDNSAQLAWCGEANRTCPIGGQRARTRDGVASRARKAGLQEGRREGRSHEYA